MDFSMIMQVVVGAIRGTPIWVWILFGFLLYRAILAFSTRIVRLTNLFSMPIVFFVLALNGLISSQYTTIESVFVWTAALLVGIIVAWFMNRSLRIRADKTKHLLELPGTTSVLFMLLGIFAVKYYFGYTCAVHPELMCTTPFLYAKLACYGFISGLTIGKLLQYLHKYRTAESVSLVESR